jgi:hypothetical protein
MGVNTTRCSREDMEKSSGDFVWRNENRRQRVGAGAAAMLQRFDSNDRRKTSTRLALFWPGQACERVWSDWSRLWHQPCLGLSAPRSGPRANVSLKFT